MTRVCLLGDEGVNLQYELLSRETARDALASYDLREPFHNSVAVETVSLGGAVSLLNDLQWYLVRFVDEALVFEPSVSETEWLSRELATAIRGGETTADESGRFLKIYGVVPRSESDDNPSAEGNTTPQPESPPQLVEPMFVARTGETLPGYDLRDVDQTVRVRVTEHEFKQ